MDWIIPGGFHKLLYQFCGSKLPCGLQTFVDVKVCAVGINEVNGVLFEVVICEWPRLVKLMRKVKCCKSTTGDDRDNRCEGTTPPGSWTK